MPRIVDLRCLDCGREQPDQLLRVDEIVPCLQCGGVTEQVWWSRRGSHAQWDDATAVMIHRNPETGDIRYVGRHDAKLKPGYERVYLRSLHEVNRFERAHHVAVHAMHYDSNGRALDDNVMEGR